MNRRDVMPTHGDCFKCGKETTRFARLNDEGRINKDMPLRPVCNDCGPRYVIIEKLSGEDDILQPGDIFPTVEQKA